MDTQPRDILVVILYYALDYISETWHPNILRRVCKNWKGIFDQLETERFIATVKSDTKYSRYIMARTLESLLCQDNNWSYFKLGFIEDGYLDIVTRVKGKIGAKMLEFTITRDTTVDNVVIFNLSATFCIDGIKVDKMFYEIKEWFIHKGVLFTTSLYHDSIQKVSINRKGLRRLIYTMMDEHKSFEKAGYSIYKSGNTNLSNVRKDINSVWCVPNHCADHTNYLKRYDYKFTVLRNHLQTSIATEMVIKLFKKEGVYTKQLF